MKKKEDKKKIKKQKQDFKKKLLECRAQKETYLKGWQRAQADLLNYKKEEIERMGDILNYKTESLILEILSIMDNFDLAEKVLPQAEKENKYTKGLLQIKKQLKEFLKEQGVEEIETLGKELDLSQHEPVEQVEGQNNKSGTIVEEIQKGYMFQGKLIRAAKVKVVK